MKQIKCQLEDEDYKKFMSKVNEQFIGRGAIRKFLEWISRNQFAILDNNLKTMLQHLPLKTS